MTSDAAPEAPVVNETEQYRKMSAADVDKDHPTPMVVPEPSEEEKPE